jgi:hypothetical protein
MKHILKIAILVVMLMPFFASAQDLAFVKKYAGTYQMVADGQKPTATSDNDVLSADGKGVWTMFTTTNPDGTVSKKPTSIKGTWFATEGVIHLQFNMGADKGGELNSEFSLKDGVFKAEGIYLNKVGAKAKK